jgi:fructosamine-3-kinase
LTVRGLDQEALASAVDSVLKAAGDPGPISDIRRVGGGDINRAARVETARGCYFVKWHPAPQPGVFTCEAKGLALLAAGSAARVPAVVGAGSVPESGAAFLVLEWIERGSGKDDSAAALLGRQLAGQHLTRHARYGLDHDNYIGRLPQPNAPSDSWVDFYASQRLGAQRDQAARNGLLPPARARLLDRLIASLDRWIDEPACQPSLLHGDLWGGNWMVSAAGEPVLIDPAVYYGDREADLAMTRLFGGFPQAFYDAYNEVFPLAPGHAEREPLYRLYYLLCHLNLFGESYGGSVDGILRRYGGS